MARLAVFFARLIGFAIPAVFGLLAVVYADALKQPPGVKETARPAVPVRVITLAQTPMIPQIVGYGTVGPAREWRGVARVEGDVVQTAPTLAPGEIVSEGDLLVRIDDTDLLLNLAQITAQLTASDIKDQTLVASLEIANADLALVQADLTRQEQLANQGVATRTSLDAVRRQEISARAKVIEIENQRQLAKAEREILGTQRSTLERALEFIELRAPYDLRLTEVSATQGQYVSRGQTMLAGEGVAAVEIAAQFPLGRVGPLLRLAGGGSTVLDLKARVRLVAPGHNIIWKSQVVRIGDAVDARTQGTTVVVRVDDPLTQAAAGERPPLRRNMLVEVLLMAPEIETLIVPVEAVRDGTALVVNSDGKLEKRKVTVGFTSGNLAVVTNGLVANEQLVITSPTVAVPGMMVKPIEDTARKAALLAEAMGKAPSASGGSEQGQGKGKSMEAGE